MQWLYLYFPSLQLDSLLHQVGIKIGAGLAQAALLCAQLKVITYDSKQEQRLLTQLAQRL